MAKSTKIEQGRHSIAADHGQESMYVLLRAAMVFNSSRKVKPTVMPYK
jgi:hypothetical protein